MHFGAEIQVTLSKSSDYKFETRGKGEQSKETELMEREKQVVGSSLKRNQEEENKSSFSCTETGLKEFHSQKITEGDELLSTCSQGGRQKSASVKWHPGSRNEQEMLCFHLRRF